MFACGLRGLQLWNVGGGSFGSAFLVFGQDAAFLWGEAFFLTVGAVSLTVEFLCLQAVEVLIRLAKPKRGQQEGDRKNKSRHNNVRHLATHSDS